MMNPLEQSLGGKSLNDFAVGKLENNDMRYSISPWESEYVIKILDVDRFKNMYVISIWSPGFRAIQGDG